MARIDELLRAEGERWRGEVDAHCPMTATSAASALSRPARASRLPSRPMVLWATALSGAAAAATGLGVLIAHSTPADDNSSASSRGAVSAAAGGGAGIAAPASTRGAASSAASCAVVTFGVTPRRVARGGLLTISGDHYGFSACASSQPRSDSAVTVRLTTADGRTVTLVRVSRLGAHGSFRARVTVPTTAASGPATVSDGQGHRVALLVTDR